ncbi:MAG: hypothetical protein WCG27_10865 [Pseudomonadota bacterium]
MENSFNNFWDWWSSPNPMAADSVISNTRDVFQSRLDRFCMDLIKKKYSENEVALLGAIIGEIGNNSFDHNLGLGRDVSGCWFHYSIGNKEVQVNLADRGVGFLKSLKRVVPTLVSDQDAMEMAFEKRISGRAPEKRGNGLKFVRQIINGNANRALYCFSGKGKLHLGGLNKKQLDQLSPDARRHGVLMVILWKQNEN